MNANELKINGNTLEDFLQTSREVDEYDNLDCRICAADSIRQLVDFVRQQQSEIEALKEKVFELEEKLFDSEVIDAETLLNEPVAWMVEDDEDISFIMNGKGLAKPDASWKSVTPVYIHPSKDLTDEEIMECKAHVEVMYGCLAPLEFAWAILRKAQEI